MTDRQTNTSRSPGATVSYRAGIGLACATGLVLLWINAAAGIIGDGPVNLMYVGVVAVGMVGAYVSDFQPRGLTRVLYATAAAQMLVPVIALAMWKAGWQELLTSPTSPKPPFDPGVASVFALNAVFALSWLLSAILFRFAGQKSSGHEQSVAQRS